jgi:photosystem II stability/assembly factor-like uncharacterized protein
VAQSACQTGFAVADAASAATPNVLYTSNGASWAATATDPFATDEHAVAVECFPVGRDDIRVIVARGSTDADDPAEIAYSDDNGATWTAVNVGAVDGQFAPTRHSLAALDSKNVYLGADDGYIYKSEDGGLTWTAVESGAIHTAEWNAIHVVDEDVVWAGGAANVIVRSVDGGDSWSELTGPSAQSAAAVVAIFAFDRNRAWVGYNDGDLYYTVDGGVTWSARSFSGSGTGQVRDITFLDDAFGVLVHNNASPVGTAFVTKDGGFTWESVTTPTNAGVNVAAICDERSFYIAGEPQGGTGYIAKAAVS